MRILHLVKTAAGATWALRQMRELVQLGVDVHVALPHGKQVAEYRAAGIIVHPLQFDFPIRTPWRLPGLLRLFRQFAAQIKPDIIHSHFVGTSLTMRLALGKNHPTPRIFQVPGPLHLEHGVFSRAELFTSGRSDFWIGSSRWTCDFYRQAGVAADRIFLSYYGTDLENFTVAKHGKLRQELGIVPDTKIIGMVAYMYAPKRYLGQKTGLKGHEDLIDALAICLRRAYNVVGVFVGGAWNGAVEYEKRVRSYGQAQCGERAIFLGTRYDVLEFYPDIDVAVHPSHSENVGGAVESLLMAVPTIATRVGGFPEIVTPDETGWLVSPGEPAAIAESIVSALKNPQEAHEMALRGQQRARQLFDVKQTAQQIFEIYRKILA